MLIYTHLCHNDKLYLSGDWKHCLLEGVCTGAVDDQINVISHEYTCYLGLLSGACFSFKAHLCLFLILWPCQTCFQSSRGLEIRQDN